MFLVSLAAVAADAGNGIIRRAAQAVPGEYIVVLEDRDHPNPGQVATELVHPNMGTVKRVYSIAPVGFVARLTAAHAQALARHPAVRYVEENGEGRISGEVSASQQVGTTAPQGKVWHLDRIDQIDPPLNNSYRYCSSGIGVTVYVLDTGVQADHPEFTSGQVVDGYDPFDNWPPYPRATDPFGSNPCSSGGNSRHGTHVASVLAGQTFGVAKRALLVPVAIGDCAGTPTRTNRSPRWNGSSIQQEPLTSVVLR